MKKFLLSIVCCLMAVVNGYAEEVTKSVTFSSYTAGTQYAKNEKHDLGDGLVIYTTDCHFTTQLRIYSSASNNGYVVSDALPGTITKMNFNAGYKKDNLLVYGSNDGTTWTLVGKVAVTSTSNKDYSFDFTGNYSRFKLDVEGTNQIRLQSMSVTYTTSGAPETPKETVATPVINPSTTTFNTGESVSVSITTETEGATIYYTTNGDTPTAESFVYSAPFEVNTTTTVKAIAVKDGWNNSEVAEVKYTMVDPNAVEKTGTISFASTTQRVSQDGNSQVWKNDNITFTNNKTSSSNSVVSNVNPVRLYANSEISIEAPGNITKIVFDCNSSDYATALKNSIGDAATASSDKVTVTLDGTSNSFTIAKLSAQVRLDALTVTYIIDEGTTIIPTLNSPIFSSGSCLFVNQIEVSITAEEGATVYYTLDGSNPTTGSATYNGVITLTETTTVKAFAVKDGYKDSEIVEATYTKRVLQEGQIEDYLTVDLIGETGNSYTSWKDKKSNSAAVYAGQSISNIDNIQLRSDKDKNNNYSGIVTTTSGGKVKKIIVEWGGATANGRTLNIYGKNDAYSNPNDLYDNTKSGENLGTIVKGTSTELEITGDYRYIGLRSNSDAMYITSIIIIWEPYTLNITDVGYATFTADNNFIIPDGVEGGIVTVKGTTANVEYVYTKGDIVPAGTGLLMKGAQGEYKMYATTQEATEVYAENLLKGALTNEEITAPAGSLLYIFAKDIDSGLGFYWQNDSGNGQRVQNMAGKAYLQVPTTSAVKGFRLNLGDTTGITAVETTNGNAPIYTLSGVRVNGSLNNLPAGIYIVGGKKVYVK